MEIELTLQDVEHLESKMEDLVGWMTPLTLLMNVNALCVIALRGKCNWPLKSLI